MKLGSLIIVDDDSYSRTLLATALKGVGFDILLSTGSASESFEPFSSRQVDLALIDLDLGRGPNGKDVAYKMRELQPNIGLVLITSFTDHRAAGDPWRVLPIGMRHITKTKLEDINQLVKILLLAKSKPLSKINNQKSEESPLTDNQIELLRLINMGFSNQEIARQLHISVSGVEKTISRINHILNFDQDNSLNPRIALVRYFSKLTGKG